MVPLPYSVSNICKVMICIEYYLGISKEAYKNILVAPGWMHMVLWKTIICTLFSKCIFPVNSIQDCVRNYGLKKQNGKKVRNQKHIQAQTRYLSSLLLHITMFQIS